MPQRLHKSYTSCSATIGGRGTGIMRNWRMRNTDADFVKYWNQGNKVNVVTAVFISPYITRLLLYALIYMGWWTYPPAPAILLQNGSTKHRKGPYVTPDRTGGSGNLRTAKWRTGKVRTLTANRKCELKVICEPCKCEPPGPVSVCCNLQAYVVTLCAEHRCHHPASNTIWDPYGIEPVYWDGFLQKTVRSSTYIGLAFSYQSASVPDCRHHNMKL